MSEGLTVKYAALVLGAHPETVRKWIREGRLRATLQGSRTVGYRIAPDDLQPLFENLARKEHSREKAMLEQGLSIPCVFEESAEPLKTEGGRLLPNPPLPSPFASNTELFEYIELCTALSKSAIRTLKERLAVTQDESSVDDHRYTR